MKRMLSVLAVVLVFSIVPAASVAHTFNGWGDYSSYCFWEKAPSVKVVVQPGPNYVSAEHSGAIKWLSGKQWGSNYKSCYSGCTNAGSVDLEGISDMNTTMVNVIDVNVTNTGYKTIKAVSLQVGVAGDFPNGSLYLSTDHMTGLSSQNITWKAFTSGAYTYYTFSFGLSSHATKVLYLSFHLPASNQYNESNGNIWYKVTTGSSGNQWSW